MYISLSNAPIIIYSSLIFIFLRLLCSLYFLILYFIVYFAFNLLKRLEFLRKIVKVFDMFLEVANTIAYLLLNKPRDDHEWKIEIITIKVRVYN